MKETIVQLIISEECQSGKTTWIENEILDNLDFDHFLFTHNTTNTHTDAVDKFFEEARKRGLSPRLITNKKDLGNIQRDRLKGIIYPVVAIFLGNISHFKATKALLASSEHTGIKQNVYLDEIHRYTLGEDIESEVQIDNFVNELLKNNQADQLWCISATAHDILYTDIEFGENSRVLKPYPGFKGIRNARWVTLDESVFKTLLDSYKTYKHKGIDSNLPEEIIEILDVYAAKDMLINLHSEKAFHSWMAQKIIDGGAYNGSIKSLTGNFVGKLSMAMSTTFPDHNKILYYNKMNNTSQIGAIMQELGRVNGKKTPVIITTEKVKNGVMEFLDYNKFIVEEEVYKLPAKTRHSYLSSFEFSNPYIVPGAKHRQNRKITAVTVNKEGNIATCNEGFAQLYLPELYNEHWEGKGIGKRILNGIKEAHPALFDHIKDFTYITDTDTRSDGDIWIKRREHEQVRFGKNWARPGYVSIVVRKSLETGYKSFYDVTGELYSDETETIGHIYTNAEWNAMREAEKEARRRMELELAKNNS